MAGRIGRPWGRKLLIAIGLSAVALATAAFTYSLHFTVSMTNSTDMELYVGVQNVKFERTAAGKTFAAWPPFSVGMFSSTTGRY